MSIEPARLPLRQRGRRPPRHLSAESRRLWLQIQADYVLEAHHCAILERACEALDRLLEARAAIEKDGAYVTGRFGVKAHPGLAVERDSRIAFARLIRELGLDLETPASLRPPTRWRDA